MNAIEVMAKQLTEHPTTSNGVVVKSDKMARLFMRMLGNELGWPKVLFSNNGLCFDFHVRRRDFNFAIFPEGHNGIIGSRFTGLLLVDVVDVDERYWLNTALPCVTSEGNWLPFHAYSDWHLLDKEKFVESLRQ